MSEPNQPPRSVTTDSEAARMHAALDLICDGSSVRHACVTAGISRTVFYRRVGDDAELRARYEVALALRAHNCADLIEEIASGRESADATARAVLNAVADVEPAKVEKVARAILRESVQRDRLRVDSAKWVASRMLPSLYGHQAAAMSSTANVNHRIAIVFEEPPSHALDAFRAHTLANPEPAEHADYEVLDP